MPTIPIDNDDVAAGRALRAEFARFWSTERGEARAVYDRFIAATPIAANVTVQHVTEDPGPGVWVLPNDAAPDRVLLFLHGGGYGLGSASAYAGLVSHIAARAEVAAFVLDYPLAPESQLPDALNLAVATLAKLCHDHPAVAIAGDSAGGGLALSTAAEAHREQIEVAAVTVFSPWTDLSLSGASVRRHAIGDPLLDPAYLQQSAAAYLGNAAAEDSRASPLFGISGELPPLLIQVGTDEILLDDSIRFATAVERAGGTVTLEVWEGMHHVFQLNIAQLATARRAVDHASAFLSSHLTAASGAQ
ncbi:alpha/beta hydrolase [Mycobacterium sp. URHB0044]|uniref:alpha/beta hydrolase n=1 Tax=Mycobacterium sp. URHB0044 TaxID=1380386 RepID=UPI000566B8C5|nr:alpha/beta hydrolase [Mycobacterium sp. URHB0044]